MQVKWRAATARHSRPMIGSSPEPPVSAELLARHDGAGPRYTSYPTADRFVEAFGAAEHAQALAARSSGPLQAAAAAPLSVYVHVPFCESLCSFCACDKVITRRHGRALPYLDALEREIGLTGRALGRRAAASQLHLGGGTPTFLDDGELARLVGALERGFDFVAGADRAIEVDPRTVDAARIGRLAALGFDRLSLGVQDFDAAVQRAVNRVHDVDRVARLLEAARASGFRSTSVDLLYGLPKQTIESFRRTLETVAELRPERVAVYAYAHLPQRFKAQRRIDAAALPNGAARVVMLARAIERLGAAGYVHLGMDHFVLPGDALALARAQGRLQRNLQGYTTQPDGDEIGLGVAAISRLGATYSQNAKSIADYEDAIAHGQFATARGLALDRDDVLRRAVVMAIVCRGRVDFEAIAAAHLVDVERTFAAELKALARLQANGLVELDGRSIALTPLGGHFVRSVAMVFDRRLQADHVRDRYSRLL